MKNSTFISYLKTSLLFILLLALSPSWVQAQSASVTAGINPVCEEVDNSVTISYSGLNNADDYQVFWGGTYINTIASGHGGAGSIVYNTQTLNNNTPIGFVFINQTTFITEATAPFIINPFPVAPPDFVANYTGNYDGAFHLGSVTVGSGESVVWYDADPGGSISTGLKNVGSTTFYAARKIDATGCESHNRTNALVTITAKPLTVTVTANNKVYNGDNTATLNSTLVGVVAPDVVTLDASLVAATFNNKNVGVAKTVTRTGTYSLAGADMGNYSLTQPSAPITANITAKALTLTANNQAKCFNSFFFFTGNEFGLSGLVLGDVVNGATFTSAAAFTGGAASLTPYAIIPSAATGADVGNYDITYVNGGFTVNGLPTASFTINDDAQCLVSHSFVFTNTSSHGLGSVSSTYLWSASPAGQTPNGLVPANTDQTLTFNQVGSAVINLRVTNDKGCSTSTNLFSPNVTIVEHPTAAFTTAESSGVAANDYNICTGATVNFNAGTSNRGFGSTSISTYQWRRDGAAIGGAPNTVTYSPVVTGVTNPDVFDYSLRVMNNEGCWNIDAPSWTADPSRTINVYPFSVPGISTPVVGTQGQYGVPSSNGNGGQLLCHSKVVFGNTTTLPPGGSSVVSYIWNFGDGSSSDVVSTADNVKHEFPVNYNINWFDAAFPNTRYTIELTAVTNQGCSTTTTTARDIKNGPDAVIGLTGATTQPLVGNSYLFHNASQNRHPSFIDSSLWNWGDGTWTTNTTFIPKVYTAEGSYRVHVINYTGTGCTDTAHLDLTVGAAVAANFTTTPNTCGSKVVGFTSSSTGATSYSWNFGDGSPADVTANPSHTYAADGSYTVILTINGTIASDPQTIYVVSNPVVGAIVNAGPSTCGNTYSFSNVSTGVNLSYAWTFGGAASTGATSTTSSANRVYSVAGSATVDLIVSADGRCPVSATQLGFTSLIGGVTPVAGVSIAAASVPSNTSKSVNNTSTNGSLYYVSLDGAAFVAKTVFPYDITGLANGSHTIRLVASDLLGTCKDTATATFTISSTPCIAVAGINATPATTQTLATNRFDFFNTTVVNGFGWISANSWDFGDGTSSTNTHVYGKTYASAGTYTVTLVATMSPGGCTSTATQVVTVSAPAPVTGSSFTKVDNNCITRTVAFTSTSVGATSYSWNFGDGSPADITANPSHTYAADGAYTVILTINGSIASAPQTVTVVSNPVVGPVNLDGIGVDCGRVHTYSNVSTGTNLSYAWTFSGAASTGPVSTTSTATRTYTVSLPFQVDLIVTADGRCPVSATNFNTGGAPAIIGTSPIAVVGNGPASVPSPTSVAITNASTNASLYAISIDGAAFFTQLTYPYDLTGLTNGSHTVRLVAAATGWTCKDTATTTFTISSTPCVAVAGFNITPSSTQPLATNKFDFFNTTVHNGFGWVTSYTWDFGDGTTNSVNTFVYGKTFASVGTYNVTLTAVSSTGCTSTSTQVVTITPSAAATFSYTQPACGIFAVPFNSSASTSATSYSWNFGDGSAANTNANPTHTYAAAGSYDVILTINGSIASTPQTVVVGSAPTGLSIIPTLSTCGNVYTFTGSATGTGVTYSWSFANLTGTGGTTGAAVTRTYSAAGLETAILTATIGQCSTTTTLSGYSVDESVTSVSAALQVTAANACNGTRTINNTGSVGASSYAVSLDGGAYVVKTSFPYDVTGLAVGSHTVSLKAINGLCEDIETSTFEVGSLTAGFTASSSTCGPTVTFTNTTTSTYGTPTYSWNFNSGEGSSTATSPSYTFLSGGTKTVTLTASLANGCESTSTNAAIIATPGSGATAASFTSAMVVSGPCNTGVQFTSTSTGALSYVWNYGDGTVSVPSTTTGIFHAYSSTGTFVVTLTAYGACSQTSTATANVVVTATGYPVPEVSFSTDNATQCINGNRYDFFNRTQLNGAGWVPTYSWNFGDGTTDNVNSFVYGKTYAAAGTYTVTLTGTSNMGCSNSSSMQVTVSALPCSPRIYNPGKDVVNNDGGQLDQSIGSKATTGLNNNAKDISNEISLYPNPNNGEFKLGIKDFQSNTLDIVIIDVLGREVFLDHVLLNGRKEIELSDLNLSPGTYSLILNGADGISARKNFVVVSK
jgi:PKD repeat protein